MTISLDPHPDRLPTPSLTIIGVGPGDPELLTIKGLNALLASDVIFAPIAAEDKPSIALSIIRRWVRPEQRVVFIHSPMVRDEAVLQEARQQAAEIIVRELAPNRRGAYILLGDPMLYGTFTPIARRLRIIAPDIQQTIVPGVTAISAAAAATETPLASGSERVVILPGLRERSRNTLLRLLRQFSQVAILKAGPVFPMLAETLEAVGMLENAVYVENLGLPGERVVRGEALLQMPRQKRPYLSLMLVNNPNAGNSVTDVERSSTYPAYLTNLDQKRVVVVGGGSVGERKVRGLLAADAQPVLISPDVTPQLQNWVQEGLLEWRRRGYAPADVQNAHLVFAATDDPALNARIARDASVAGAWCNVADNGVLGDFHVPAVHRGDGFVISVGTNGKAPARASTLRDRIAAWLAAAQ